MNEARYTKVNNTPDYQTFSFASNGKNGSMIKIVRFDEILSIPNTYNLALGTLLPNGSIDFETITNNGDRNKILSTVASIIFVFLEKYPGNKIYISGSDNRRTLLYQRAIIYAYEELTETFNIYGDSSAENDEYEFELFDKAKNYSAFLVERNN